MKIAVTTSGTNLNASVDSRFGRAPKYIIFDLETNAFSVVDNAPNLNAVQGAGIQAAETVIRAEARALVTGHCGPKAFRVLSAAGVKIHAAENLTVAEAIERFRNGTLPESSSADVEGHW